MALLVWLCLRISSSSLKDKGVLLARVNSPNPHRKQIEGSPGESDAEGCGPAFLSLRKDLLAILSSIDKNVDPVSCDDEIDPRKGCL